MKLHHAYLLLACFAASPALALALVSTSVPANLNGSRADTRPDKHVATGPRTDDTRNCDSRGVTVQSDNGSSSASTPPGGSSTTASGGSSGPRTEFFGCEAGDKRSTR